MALTAAAFCWASLDPAWRLASLAIGSVATLTLRSASIASMFLKVAMLSGVLRVGLTSVCWTAKQPPKGPATALLRQRTVQMLPVEAVWGQMLLVSVYGGGKEKEGNIPPVHLKFCGIVTVKLKSWILFCEMPLAPGTLLVTVRFWLMRPELDVSSRSQT